MAGNSGPVSIEVDLDGLLLLVNHLKNIRKDIFELGQGGPADVVGGMGQASVQSALDAFTAAWTYGLTVIGQDMDTAFSLAQGAHDAYQTVETDLSAATTGGTPASSGQSQGGGGAGW